MSGGLGIGMPVAFGGGSSGGGGGGTTYTAGAGLILDSDQFSADFGVGADKVQLGTKAAIETTLALTSGIVVATAGVLSIVAALAGDVTGAPGTNAVISLTGTANKVTVAATGRAIEWAAATTTPSIGIADKTTNSGTGETLSVLGQNETGTTSIGGAVAILAGTGTSTNGGVQIGNRGAATFADAGSVRLQQQASILARATLDATNIHFCSVDANDVLSYGSTLNRGVRIGTSTGNTIQAQINAVTQLTIDATNATFVGVPIAPSYQLTNGSGPTITTGAGAPGSTPAAGSLYLRNNGAASTTAYVYAASAWSTLGPAWAGDLAGSDNTTQIVVALTGTSNQVTIASTGRTLAWAAATTTPSLKQLDNSTNSATAATLTIQAANATGTTSTGGALNLTSGTGTTAAGVVNLQSGGTTVATVQVGTASVGGVLINSATANSIALQIQTAGADKWIIGNDATSSFMSTGTVGTLGHMRFPNASNAIGFRTSGGGSVVGLSFSSSNLLFLGMDASLGNQCNTRINGNSSITYAINGGTNWTMTATGIIEAAITMVPVISQTTRTSDATTNTFTIRTQQAFATASTNANGKPGDFLLDLNSATNSKTTQATATVRIKAADVLALGHDNTQGTVSFGSIEVAASAGASQGYIVFAVNGTRRKVEYYADA